MTLQLLALYSTLLTLHMHSSMSVAQSTTIFAEWKPIQRIHVNSVADFEIFVKSRDPVIIENGVPKETLKNFQIEYLERLAEHNIFVRVIPATHVDERLSNFVGVLVEPGQTREYGMTFGDLLKLLKSSGKEHPESLDRNVCRAHPLCSVDPDWEHDKWYWRWELPSDNKIDTVGRLLYDLVVYPSFFEGKQENTVEKLKWKIESTIMRGATAGTYYPAHIDCYPNLLHTLWGAKRIRMVDLKPIFKAYPEKFEDYHRILSLDDLDVEVKYPEIKEYLYVANLKEGDMLYIPPLWLHDVLNFEPSFGVNRWYTHKKHADVHLCEFLKGEGPLSIGGTLTGQDVKDAVELSMSNSPPQHHSKYPKSKEAHEDL